MTARLDPQVVQTASDCRSRLIEAANAVFSREGYRVGVDRIAAEAGVAKQTLYNHFPSKADLFEEVIQRNVADLLVMLDDDDRSLRARLIGFGNRYREKLLTPLGLGFYRTLVAESGHFPELTSSFYRNGPARTMERLQVVLGAAMARGELRAADPVFAATMLLSMLVGAERNHYLFSGEPVPPPEPAKTANIIDCFLRAFAPC